MLLSYMRQISVGLLCLNHEVIHSPRPGRQKHPGVQRWHGLQGTPTSLDRVLSSGEGGGGGGGGGGGKLPPKDFVNDFFSYFPQCTDTFSLEVKFMCIFI